MSDLDALISLAVEDAEVETGRPLGWLVANGRDLRPKQAVKPARSPRWSPEEDAFLEENLGRIPLEEIARALGRSVQAIKVHFTRRGLTPARHLPGYLSATAIARLLGVDSHGPPCWVDLGLLPGEPFPYQGRVCRRVRWIEFKKWLIRPTSWVYFRVERIRNAHLRRLVELAQERWGDEWWSTRQAADYHGCQPSDIHRMIQTGKLTGYHAVGMDRRRVQSWAYWFVRRSEAERLVLPKRTDDRSNSFTPAADAFLLQARYEWRLSPAIIARLMKRNHKVVDYRLRRLRQLCDLPEPPKLLAKLSSPIVEKACARCGQAIHTKRSKHCPNCRNEIRLEKQRQRDRERYRREHPEVRRHSKKGCAK